MNNNSFERHFSIKRNDNLPSLVVKIKTRGCLDEVLPLSLTGVSAVTFSMISECGDLIISSNDAIISDAENGVIEYQWQQDDTATAGKFKGEFELFFNGGGKISIPRTNAINIQVFEDINES